MEGTPSDLTTYKDTILVHDHTYFGRGCKNSWGTDGEGGSQTPCADSDSGGRYVETADDEIQKNGTYFNFQAITSGSGGSLNTNNADAPDTFCPLGWQLPYSGTDGDYYDKSKSWRYLLNRYSISSDQSGVTNTKSYPFSYVFSGYYSLNTGRLYVQEMNGYYWSSTVVNSTNAYNLNMWSSGIQLANTPNKANGSTLRCTLGISNLKALHGIRVHSLVLWLFIF